MNMCIDFKPQMNNASNPTQVHIRVLNRTLQSVTSCPDMEFYSAKRKNEYGRRFYAPSTHV